MFEPVKHQGMTCWADSYRKVGYSGLVLLSVFGNRNAVKAVWATLVGSSGKRNRHESVLVGEHYVRRMDDAVYSTIQAPLGEGQIHMVLLHASATQQSSIFESSFYQMGPSAETRYFARLSQLCPVPLRRKWRDDIWAIGLEGELIVPLEGFGMTIHQIDTTGEKWAPLVQKAIVEGKLR